MGMFLGATICVSVILSAPASIFIAAACSVGGLMFLISTIVLDYEWMLQRNESRKALSLAVAGFFQNVPGKQASQVVIPESKRGNVSNGRLE